MLIYTLFLFQAFQTLLPSDPKAVHLSFKYGPAAIVISEHEICSGNKSLGIMIDWFHLGSIGQISPNYAVRKNNCR
jgi:hypothetical protein